jgi:hypothetical protein
MGDVLEIKRGDLKPDAIITITDPVATFDEVTGWRVILKRGDTTFIDDAPDVDTTVEHTAIITHHFTAPETASSGTLSVEVEATWPVGEPQSFPFDGFLTVRINSDLG